MPQQRSLRIGEACLVAPRRGVAGHRHAVYARGMLLDVLGNVEYGAASRGAQAAESLSVSDESSETDKKALNQKLRARRAAKPVSTFA